MVQTGGPGGVTSVFIRGTNANDTKVLDRRHRRQRPELDQGSFDFSHVLLSDVERIEVLRGPQSGLYGSDAIGGVVNIMTQIGLGSGASSPAASKAARSTRFNQTGGGERLARPVQLRRSISRTSHTGATPVTPPNSCRRDEAVTSNDSYDNVTATTKLGFKVTDNFDLGFVVRFIDYHARFTEHDDSRAAIPTRRRAGAGR